jgi:hypothetical protein
MGQKDDRVEMAKTGYIERVMKLVVSVGEAV